MADPRGALETALCAYLADELGVSTYNTRATGATAPGYVLVTCAGSDDTWLQLKNPCHMLNYEIVAVDLDRADADTLADSLGTAMAAIEGAYTVTGFTAGEVRRTGAVDRVDIMADGRPLYSVGAVWQFEIWEV